MSDSTLLADFGHILGIDLSFDENNQCLLELDGQLLVSIRRVDENYFLYGMLGEFPDDPGSEFWKGVLSMNRDLAEENSGFVCFEQSTDCLVLIQPVSGYQLDAITFQRIVEKFVETQETLIAKLTSVEDGEEAEESYDGVDELDSAETSTPTHVDRLNAV